MLGTRTEEVARSTANANMYYADMPHWSLAQQSFEMKVFKVCCIKGKPNVHDHTNIGIVG